MNETILSILICTIPGRRQMFDVLQAHLYAQMTHLLNHDVVQVLWDESSIISTGHKRNILLQQADGRYIVFIDDDDMVPEYYISEILNAATLDTDCMAINGTMSTDGSREIKWRISKDYINQTILENGHPLYLRTTNHIAPVKREIALKGGFPDKSNAEDKAYSEAIHSFLKTECKIARPMYHYRYSTINKSYK